MKQETSFFVVINILPNHPPYTSYFPVEMSAVHS